MTLPFPADNPDTHSHSAWAVYLQPLNQLMQIQVEQVLILDADGSITAEDLLTLPVSTIFKSEKTILGFFWIALYWYSFFDS